MLVRAISKCFVDGSRRRVGDIFEYDGRPASYLVPVTEDEAGASAPAPSAAPAKQQLPGQAPAEREMESTVVAGKTARIPKRPKDFLDEVI